MALRMGITMVWLAAIYLAVVLQTGLGDNGPRGAAPVWTAIVAAWAVTSQSSMRGVVWAALAGLACDAAGHGRLGLHLATYSVLAAIAATWWSHIRPARAAMTIVVAAWFAGGDELASRGLAPRTAGDAQSLMHVVLAAFQTAAATAGAVLIVVVGYWAMRRLLRVEGGPVRLKNRWSMLTE